MKIKQNDHELYGEITQDGSVLQDGSTKGNKWSETGGKLSDVIDLPWTLISSQWMGDTKWLDNLDQTAANLCRGVDTVISRNIKGACTYDKRGCSATIPYKGHLFAQPTSAFCNGVNASVDGNDDGFCKPSNDQNWSNCCKPGMEAKEHVLPNPDTNQRKQCCKGPQGTGCGAPTWCPNLHPCIQTVHTFTVGKIGYAQLTEKSVQEMTLHI